MQSDSTPKAAEPIVVVGASHAGIAFADAMRSNGYQGKMLLIDRLETLPTERPPLSKAFLLDAAMDDNKHLLRKPEWYTDNQIELHLGTTVTAIDREAKTIETEDGSALGYGTLVLCTGASPRMLPAAAGLAGVHVVRSPADATALRAVLSDAKRAIVIGGGYIGLEVAASMTKAGLQVDVIEAADRLLARVASPEISVFFAELHDTHGVGLHIGMGVRSVQSEGNVFTGVVLEDGQELSADLLVVGIGVAPETNLASAAGLACGNGILVDLAMCAADPDIYAIGDVALAGDSAPQVAGQPIRVESVHNAQDSAVRAAAAINGHAPPDWQSPWFWSEQFDVRLQSAGIVPPAGDDVVQVVRPGKREGGMSVWSFVGDELHAIEAVRDPAGYMLGKKCLDMGRHPTPKAAGDPDFDLKAFLAG